MWEILIQQQKNWLQIWHLSFIWPNCHNFPCVLYVLWSRTLILKCIFGSRPVVCSCLACFYCCLVCYYDNSIHTCSLLTTCFPEYTLLKIKVCFPFGLMFLVWILSSLFGFWIFNVWIIFVCVDSSINCYNHHLSSSLCNHNSNKSHNNFFLVCKVIEMLSWIFFFAILVQIGAQKLYLLFPFTTGVYPTITASASTPEMWKESICIAF